MNRKHTIAALTLLVSTVALAASPVSSPVLGEVGSPNLDTAATAALQAATKVSTSVEEAGALYELNGLFYYTSPASNAADAQFNIRIAFPQGAKLIGLYHTHPAAPNNDMFSPNDLDIANSMHVTSYIAVMGQNIKVLRYTPGVSKLASCDSCGDDLYYYHHVSRGTLVASL